MAPKKELFNEVVTVQKDPFFQSFDGMLNPDDSTLETRGAGKSYRIYDELLRDCHLQSEFQKRILGHTSKEWVVDPSSDDQKDIDAASGITKILKGFRLDELSQNCLDGVLKGFSIPEIIWAEKDGQIVPTRSKHVDQRRYKFTETNEPHLLTKSDMWKGQPLPERKFIYFKFGGKNDNPYGLGLGYALFWPVFFKRKGVASWNVFCERFGMPAIKGTYPAGSGQTEVNKLLQAAQAVREQTAIAIPEGMLLEMWEAQRSGSVDTYDRLCAWCDSQISKCILGFSNASDALGGSRAAEGTRTDTTSEVIKADADMLSDIFNQTLMVWLTEFNFPGAKPPKFSRVFAKERLDYSSSLRDANLVRIGVPIPLSYFYEKYNIPTPKPDEEVIKMDPQAQGQTPTNPFGFAENPEEATLSDEALIEKAAIKLAESSSKTIEKRLRQVIALAESTRDPAAFKKALNGLHKSGGEAVNDFAADIQKAIFSTKIMGRKEAAAAKK